MRLVPSVSDDDGRIHATVFAGYKQDFDGQPTVRACEVVDDRRDVLVALPSVLANAVPNALDALDLIRRRLEGTTSASEVRWGADVRVGPLTEDAGHLRWSQWRDFAHMYGVSL